jgi:hypothetical protein
MTTNHEKLCTALRAVNAAAMTTQEVVEHCRSAAPDAAWSDIAAALRAVGEEQMREADALELYDRCRTAGITRVIDGGGDAA